MTVSAEMRLHSRPRFRLLAIALMIAFMLITGAVIHRLWFEAMTPRMLVGTPPLVYSAQPPLQIATLAEIVGLAEDNESALQAVVDYYANNRDHLIREFREMDDTRLRALYGMYIVHLAVPYFSVEREPTNLVEFVSAPSAHCGTYAMALGEIYSALGLHWRSWSVSNGSHALLDVDINGKWETFDATSNLWLSVAVDELVAGAPRSYRLFYTPSADINAEPRYLMEGKADAAAVIHLRRAIPLWGIHFLQWSQDLIDSSEPV